MEITLPLYADVGTRKLIGAQGGSPELPASLPMGDQVTCELRTYEKIEGALREVVPRVRSLRASMGRVMQPPTAGAVTLTATRRTPAIFNSTSDRLSAVAVYEFDELVVYVTSEGTSMEEDIEFLNENSEGSFTVTEGESGTTAVITTTNGGPAVKLIVYDDGGETEVFGGLTEDETNSIAFNASPAALTSAFAPAGVGIVNVSAPAASCWVFQVSSESGDNELPDLEATINTLDPVSFARVRSFWRGEQQWHELRFIESPYAFTEEFERILPAAPSVSRVITGGSDSANDDIKVNELQALRIPTDFRGTYVLNFDLRQTAILGTQDGPEEIAAALNAMWEDGEERFQVSNPEDEVANIEFVGPLEDSPQDLITAAVKTNPPGVLTFTIDLATAELADALRAVAEVTVAFEVELEVLLDGEDEEDEDAATQLITIFSQQVKLTREQIYEELRTVRSINFLKPPAARDYTPFTLDQIITGSQHYVSTFGNGVLRSFTFTHNLATAAVHATVRVNAANGRLLVHGRDYTLESGDDPANELTLTLADHVAKPAANGLAIVITSAGPTSAFQAHTHTIGQITGLTEALALLAQRVTAIENLLPSVSPTVSTDTDEAFAIKLPDRVEVYPGRFAANFAPRQAALTGDGLPRPPGLLPAVHDATVDDLNALPLPVASAQTGKVFRNNTTGAIVLPGALGRRSSAVPKHGYFASDGRALYRVSRGTNVSSIVTAEGEAIVTADGEPISAAIYTNSFFPLEFDRELFMVHISEQMLRAGQAFSFEGTLSLALLKANTRGQVLLLVEVGVAPGDTVPAPTAPNLQDITWLATPLLSQRLVLSSLVVEHKFGAAVRRSAAGVLSADKMLYGAWSAAGQAPTSPSFTLRARIVGFDTENAVDNERGFFFYDFHEASAQIQ